VTHLAAKVALVAFDAGEPSEHRREGIVGAAVKRVDLTVAKALVDDGTVLSARRAVGIR
jgi:N-acetylglucosamine-6-phosphate deacetylase